MSLLSGIAQDRERSPYTGWTRRHWEALADDLLLSARPYASPGHALVTFPGAPGGYGRAVDGLEGFARSFMTAGFRLAGEGGRDPLGIAQWYADGLAAGTDPSSPERWTRPDEHGQAKVEAAALALTLHLTRPWIWDRLDGSVQARIVDYLSTVIGADYPPINWVWFRIVVEEFLRSVDGPYDPADIEHDLDIHDTFVRAGGWYCDGPERSFDHYAGWALHLYPVLWLQMAGDSPLANTRRERFHGYLDDYLRDASRLVGADGSPLIQGRSLIYRFAAAAPFWAGALAGTTAMSPGAIRRATSGIVGHFVDHGAPDGRGLLTLGWHHEWPQLAQSYSGPGSPYWASKGLLGLVLPAEHPVWTATEEPLPVDVADTLAIAKAPGWLISSTRGDGIARVANHGTDHSTAGAAVADSPLYARLGYSTASFPILSRQGWDEPVDQSVALIGPDGRLSHRAGFETLALGECTSTSHFDLVEAVFGFSRARAHWVDDDPGARNHGSGRTGTYHLGAWIVTGSVLRQSWEVRLMRVEDAQDTEIAVGPLRVAGWPIPVETPDVSPNTAKVTSVRLVSIVAGTDGMDGTDGTDELWHREVTVSGDATPLAEWTATPWLATRAAAETGRWYVALIGLGGVGSIEAEPKVALTAVGTGAVSIAWADHVVTELTLPEMRP
jgi:hypothetical protein